MAKTIEEGSSCSMRVDTPRLSAGMTVYFVRLKHFCGGTDIVLKVEGRRAYERVALMPGKTIDDYLINNF